MPSNIITFYSYKGGVGRTFTLANTAVVLAQWGFKVLAVDWDIEAPGLHHYFMSYFDKLSPGVLEFLKDCEKGKPRSSEFYQTSIDIIPCEGKLAIMPAAKVKGDQYANEIQNINWDSLYNEHEVGSKLEDLRAEWLRDFDFVLIDSRTGLTDYSAITTAQLPDILVFLFTANEQSLKGCCDIARRAMAARRNSSLDREALVPLPLVARFEGKEEYDRAMEWRGRFAKELPEFFKTWVPNALWSDEDPVPRLIELLTIPYQARWSFGEDLAVVSERSPSIGTRGPSAPVSYAIETLAAFLANRFERVEISFSSRDEYVLMAQSAGRLANKTKTISKKIFLSYSNEDQNIAMNIVKLLKQENYNVLGASLTNSSYSTNKILKQYIEEADAMIILGGKSNKGLSKWQMYEYEYFQSSSFRSKQVRPIIPIVFKDSEKSLWGSHLANFQYCVIDPKLPLDSQMAPLIQSLNKLTSSSDLQFRPK